MAEKKAADLPVPVTQSSKCAGAPFLEDDFHRSKSHQFADNPSDRYTLRKAEALAKNLGSKFSRGESYFFFVYDTKKN